MLPHLSNCSPPCSLDSTRTSPVAHLVPVRPTVTWVCPEAPWLELVTGWTSVWVGMTTLSWHWLTTVLWEGQGWGVFSVRRKKVIVAKTHSPALWKKRPFHFILWSVLLTRSCVGCNLRWSYCCSLGTKLCRQNILCSWASASGRFSIHLFFYLKVNHPVYYLCL